MLRYRLDDLGWFSFEKLIQSLLKANLGLAVESWGGGGDFGRDAYTRARLAFPDRSLPTDGPFLFQAKFVQGASAAGAGWRPLLIKAISSENARIQQRRTAGTWREPRQYILLTNCPLTSAAREEVTVRLKAELPKSEITLLGGSDVCDLLDNHPELRRSFPEILSLRDLNLLLSEAVSKQVLERSRAAVEESRDLVLVFVPTQVYHKAWRSLQKHSFVVLDGPPEMGKTAIARTIALSHLLSDWQVIDCRDPGDFFSVFTDQRQQVFVADDAFGRTEYDPVLGRMWERDLPRVLHCLDSRHRLIWTTRKHILMRALREMDLTGKASRFPNPSEVIVTADDLSIEEKARILYRHSRAARLDENLRQLVRDNAVEIVKDDHFTPERIRRFVRDVLPDLGRRADKGAITPQAIGVEVREAIRNPTDRMRKAFLKLSENHRWILVAFLECDGAVQSDILRARFACHRATASNLEFTESLDDLLGTFLKIGYGRYRWKGKRVDWIHPSYRDLVIDELSSNPEQQIVFLKRISTTGVKLALSLAGGISGEREMPLMTTPETWDALARRCQEIASGEDADSVSKLFDILSSALQAAEPASSPQAKIEAVLRSVCEIAVAPWNERADPLAVAVLKSFFRASDALGGSLELPRIEASWEACSEEVRQSVNIGYVSEPALISRWLELVELIEQHYSQFAESAKFRARRADIENLLFDLSEEQVTNGADLQDPESNESEARRLEQLAEAIAALDRDGSRKEVVSGLYGLAQEYREFGPSYDGEDYESYEGGGSSEHFDVAALFEDL